MHAAEVKGLYQQLAALLKAYRTEALSQQLIKESLVFSEQLIETFRQSPDPLVAELSVFRPQLPYTINLAFSSCLMAALLSARNKINDSCCQQIVCASLTLYAFNQSQIEKYLKNGIKPETAYHSPRQLSGALKKANLDVWAACFEHATSRGWKSFYTPFAHADNNKTLSVLTLAHALSYSLLKHPDKPVKNFAKVLRLGFQSVSDKTAQLLTPLLAYPGIAPPGSVVKTLTGAPGLVLSVTDNMLIKTKLKASPGEPEGANPEKTLYSAVKTLAAPRDSKSFAFIDGHWDEHWKDYTDNTQHLSQPFVSSFRLDKPPGLLVDLQRQLQETDIDFNKLSTLISRDSALAGYLMESASQSSRGKLPVEDIKHGLMMHGYERASSILIQQALLLRLNQNYFPLQEAFVQFTRLRCHLAASIISQRDKSLTEQANCLACFATSGLYTLPTLKGSKSWQLQDKKPFDIRYLVNIPQQQGLHDNAIKLAEAWHQSPPMIMALRNHLLFPQHLPKHKTAGKLSVALGLSLILAREVYFAEQSKCAEGAKYRQQGMQYLGITQSQLDEIVGQSMGFCHTYCVISD